MNWRSPDLFLLREGPRQLVVVLLERPLPEALQQGTLLGHLLGRGKIRRGCHPPGAGRGGGHPEGGEDPAARQRLEHLRLGWVPPVFLKRTIPLLLGAGQQDGGRRRSGKVAAGSLNQFSVQ